MGPLSLQIGLGVMYSVLAVICVGGSASANSTLEDPSMFVPISNGVNLVLNCLAGLSIWQDGTRLKDPLEYFTAYIFVVLGTYLVSSVDFFAENQTEVAAHKVRMAKDMTGAI